MSADWAKVKNLLVMRLDNIGDVVMTAPVLRALKEALPGVRLTLMVSPAGANAVPLLPWVDDVIVWRAMWQQLGGGTGDPAREAELIGLLRGRGFRCATERWRSFSPRRPGKGRRPSCPNRTCS